MGVGTRGGSRQYADLAIETALPLRLIVHLPLRQSGRLQASQIVGVPAAILLW